MSRAGSLAGGSAGLMAVLAVVRYIVGIPLILAPFQAGGQLLLRILDLTFFGAELLAELDSTGRADFDALAAGHAVVLVDMGAISGGGEVGGVEILAGAKGKADADIAVAKTEDLIRAVDVRDLVHIAVVLGALANLKHLFFRDVAALSGLNKVVSKITETDAAIILDLAGALAVKPTCVAAGAVTDGKMTVILFKPVGNMFDRSGFVFGGNRFFNRDYMHTDAVAAGRNQVRLAGERKEGHLVKAVGELGIFFNLPENHVCHFGNAGDKQLDIPLLFMIGVLIVILDNAVIGGISQKFNNSVFRLAGKLCDLSGGLGLAQTHFEHDLRNLIAGTGSIKNDVLRVCFGQPFDTEFIRETVRDHFAEIKENLSCHSFSLQVICLSLFLRNVLISNLFYLNIASFTCHEKNKKQHRIFCGAAQIQRICSDRFLRKFTHVDPLQSVGIAIKLIEVQFDRAACAADGGKHGLEALKAHVQINGNAVVDAKGAHAADRVSDKRKHLIGRKHFGLQVEFVLEFVVVDPGVAGGENQHAAVRGFKRQRFCNTRAFYAECLSSQIDSRGRNGKFDHALFHAESTKVCASFFDGHGIPLRM